MVPGRWRAQHHPAASTPKLSDLDRIEPPLTGLGEREMLRMWLDYHRATLLMKCAGLSDPQLQERSCPPSPISLLGLVQHMTEVERGWFQRGFAAEAADPIYYSDAEPDGDFDTLAPNGVASVFDLYATTCDRARRIEAEATSLDEDGALVTRGSGSGLAAMDHGAHDRGVRPPQRSRRPDP